MRPDTQLADPNAPTALSPRALADIPAIVQRYQQGETLQALAAESQVHYRTLYRWMFTELGDAFPHVVTDTLVSRVADADLALETAADKCAIARAREQARFARMDLERRRPALYGEKREIKEDRTITVHIQRDGALEHKPQPEIVNVRTTSSPVLQTDETT